MPNIIKTKPKKKERSKKPKSLTISKPRPALKSTKSSTPDYYNCLLNYANQNWHNSVGQKQKITACCKDCKTKAPALNNQRDKELVKLITSYKQVGDSLKKLLKPIG